MECAICYEKFFTPKTQEEFEKIYKENVKNNNCDEIITFTNLLITSKHNTAHSCSTLNCECLICNNCWTKITHNGKDFMEMTEYDMPSIYDHFVCPYCRQIDWKDYMNNVFNELQKKVLGEEEFLFMFYKKCFPEQMELLIKK
jgi:hypothetical protein